MRLYIVLLLFFLFFILSCSLLITSLNHSQVIVDLLFITLESNLGKVILISFLLGSGVTLVLEIFYLIRKRAEKKISESN
ncbi:MAG: hypothetical protein CMD42_00305 [Gammaproteobacteria bacterium]|nr:hypothetical protein [Gammaproteobacteria bacterium]